MKPAPTTKPLKTITAIQAQKRRQRVNLFLDDRFTAGLNLDVLKTHRLKVGQSLSEADLEALLRAEQLHKGAEAALRFLSYRPRSEAEVRIRLLRGHEEWVVDGVLQKLKERGLIDDAAFARFWSEDRNTFRPRSRRLLTQELRRKGVSSETVNEVTQGLDDEASAYSAARAKAAGLRGLDYQDFRRKLGAYLNRRGFDYGVAAAAVNRLWREQASEGPEGEPEP